MNSSTTCTCNKLGISTCIPKQDTPKQFYWKIDVQSTVVYKIASDSIAEQIKKFLDKFITCSNDQTGFVKSRFIGGNIRRVYAIVNYTESKQISGLIMHIDFEKEFDSVTCKFIFQTLVYFNFG